MLTHVQPTTSWRTLLVACMLGIGVSLFSMALFGASGRDDPYITFSAVEAIRDAGRLVNINGDPVEQSTSLLFTLLLVLVTSALPIATSSAGWLSSLISLALMVPAAFLILAPTLGKARALAGALVVGLTPPLVYWGASGAEQALGVLLCLVTVAANARVLSKPLSVSGAVLVATLTSITYLTRPDLGLAVIGATAVVVVGIVLLERRRQGRAWLLLVPVAQATALAIISALRLLTTDSPVPQPLTAKVGVSIVEQASRGLEYLGANALSPWFIALMAVGGVLTLLHRSWSLLQTMLVITAIAILSGLTLSGGDWMELGRFFAAPAVLVATATMLQLRHSRTWVAGLTVVGLLILQVGTMIVWSTSPATFEARGSSVFSRWSLATAGSPGVPPRLDTPFNRWNADHLGDAYFLGAAVPEIRRLLDANPGRVLTITSGQGGMIPYDLQQQFGDRIRFIDRFQLMTDDFNDCNLPAGPYGAFVSWNQWQELEGGCAPALPDMAFSIGPIPVDDLGDDYTVVVHVTGTTDRNGQSLPQEQWLAVRTDLLKPL